MPEGATLAVSRLRVASVGLSVAALALFAMGMLLSWSRVAVLIVPVALGVIALGLAVRARGSAAARPGRAIAFLMSVLAMITPAVTIVAVLLFTGPLAPSAVYTLTVDSPEPVDVIIRDGADHTRAGWRSGDTITLDSNAPFVGIGAQASTPTTVISCEIRRDGKILDAEERAGSVDCSSSEADE